MNANREQLNKALIELHGLFAPDADAGMVAVNAVLLKRGVSKTSELCDEQVPEAVEAFKAAKMAVILGEPIEAANDAACSTSGELTAPAEHEQPAPVPPDVPFIISRGKSNRGLAPKRDALTWRRFCLWLANVARHHGTLSLADYASADKETQTSEKAGAGFYVLADLRGATDSGKDASGARRKKDNLAAVYGAGFDVEGAGLDEEYIRTRLTGIKHLAITSYSHSECEARWRVIVPFSTPTDANHFAAVHAHLSARLDVESTAAAKDASRLWYLPGCPEDAVGLRGFYVADGGGFFDPASVPAVAPSEQSSTSIPREDADDSEENRARLRSHAERFIEDGVIPEGAQHLARNQIVAHAFAIGLSEAAAIEGQEALPFANPEEGKAEKVADWYYGSPDKPQHDIPFGSMAPAGVNDNDFDTMPSAEMEMVSKPCATKSSAGPIVNARHLTTDLANAERIQKRYGKRLIHSAGVWFAWEGAHWSEDRGAAYRCAANLSNIIAAECRRREESAPAGESEEERKERLGIVEALRKWGKRSEEKHRIDAALAVLANYMAVPADKLNADPWSLNCLNGTVDLRTGELRPHNPDDLITRCIQIGFEPTATAPRFDQFIGEITCKSKPLTGFLRRWFGYSATGSVREQCFAIHYGRGQNGKSTLIDAVSDVLGEYAHAAPPGLLTAARGERHPTEIAALFGRRLVTAHETDDGAVLREGFVKQATGGDKLSARFMRQDFFTFDPTHTLQLITNNKPSIKGQDHAIWRRIMLVPYLARFGTAEEVAAGKASGEKDTGLRAALEAERAGILAWIVQGAAEWYRDELRAPDVVLAAVEQYRSEQDRVGQFVQECCELDPAAWTPLTDGWEGLFPAYKEWSKEEGCHPLSKHQFLEQLERLVPGFHTESKKTNSAAGGRRRSVTAVWGLRLINESEAGS